jgi:hypothetical protein
MDAPMYANKFTISVNEQKDEYQISFFMEVPKIDPVSRELVTVDNLPLSSIIVNSRMINALIEAVTELKDVKITKNAEKE